MRAFFYYPMILAGLLASTLFAAVPAAANVVTFHFYGAEDCPPCMAFKRDGLPIVQQSAANGGYAVRDNVIRRTREIQTIGVFGGADPVLRRAAERLDIVYPPIFFVTRGETILSVHGHDWRAAMQQAEIAAKTATN